MRTMESPRDLDVAIAAAEARLSELEQLRGAAAERLAELRAARARASAGAGAQSADGDWSPERKLALYASLFRGRDDVFPLRWENRAKGKTGWAPRCANEWRPTVCGKPRVRCGECPNQAFVARTERELLAHLQGRQVMGVYPLLEDDTCWLLAIDLDHRSWRADVAAVREACREFDVVPAVERSRSGDGAHVWFFFTAPVGAAVARRFGLMLLTEAMARSPTLGMASYDRLFPSQDTLAKRGFGNLIALPLQRDAREHGNTLFLDERLEPHEDQWSFLASLPRITPQRLGEFVDAGSREGRILGLSDDPPSVEVPWRPTRSLASRLAATAMPKAVNATLAQRLYVHRDDLPAALLDAMRRLATFSNPTFLERQRMRLSTARTPRVITCFEDTGRFLVLPRGCLEPLQELLTDLGVGLELSDERGDGSQAHVRFAGTLTAQQASAVRSMMAHEVGVLCAPPGAGKTVMAAELIAARGRSTLVLVHRRPLMEQWIERLAEFLDIEPSEIGTIGSGTSRANGRLDIAMVQSLARNDALGESVARYGHIVVDECHHVPAVMTERILQVAPARYITGLTATPQRRDGHHPILTMQCGPVRHQIQTHVSPASEPLTLRVVRRDTSFDPSALPTDASIQEIYGVLASDEERNELIAADTLTLIDRGRSPIVLTERREQLERLASRLQPHAPSLVTLHGEMRPAERRAALEQLRGSDRHVILATGRYIGEGFDDPRLDTLLLAMPIAWKGTIVQYAGRLHRAHREKRDALIYDYVDAELRVLRRMFAKRLKAYKSLGYEVDNPESHQGDEPFLFGDAKRPPGVGV
jgi:superfamily II DNA or RNA helicase